MQKKFILIHVSCAGGHYSPNYVTTVSRLEILSMHGYININNGVN